jgi:hypothetical protein
LGRDHPLIGFNRFLPIAHIIETMEMMALFGDEDRIEFITEKQDSAGAVG